MTDLVANLAVIMTEEQAREEEYSALCDQLKAAHHADRQHQLDVAVRMIAEMLGVSYEEAGKRVAERCKGETQPKAL